MASADVEIGHKAQELADTVPGLGTLIRRARRDLWAGPVYLAPDTDWPFQAVEVDRFDEGAKQFDFQEACDEIGDIIDDLFDTMYLGWDTGCWGSDEPRGEWYCAETDEYISEDPGWTDEEWEYIEPESYYLVEPSEFTRALLGKLAEYV